MTTIASPVQEKTRHITFLDEIIQETPGESRLEMCIQCGTCGGSCPSGQDMDHTPRQVFAMIRAGMRKEVFTSNTSWYCVSCYSCTVRCPQEIHITDIMYTIKRRAIAANMYEEKVAAGWSTSFIGYVENYGRSFELGLATRHHLRHNPLNIMKMVPLGWGMLSNNRMDLTPTRIEGVDQLQSILAKAKKLEAAE